MSTNPSLSPYRSAALEKTVLIGKVIGHRYTAQVTLLAREKKLNSQGINVLIKNCILKSVSRRIHHHTRMRFRTRIDQSLSETDEFPDKKSLLPQGKKVRAARCGYVFDVLSS
jgi:hypothetical protein